MRDYIEEEAHRLEGELCRLRDRMDNLVFECDATGDSGLISHASEAWDCLRLCICELRRLYREC